MTTVPKAKGMPPFTMTDLLLRGHPGELLPEDLARVEVAARWFIADDNQPESARRRVLSVWIERTHMSAWDPKGDTPGASDVSAEAAV